MTFLYLPNKNNPLSMLVGALIALVAISAVAVVVMYVTVTDAQHDIAKIGARVRALEAESASTRDRTFALLSSDALEAFARDHAFVIDRTPRYLTIDREWLSLVSTR